MGTVRRVATDVAVALLMVAFGVVSTPLAALNQPDATPMDAVGYALVVGTAAILAVRRRWPSATLAVAAVSTSTYLVLGYPYGPIMVAFSVAVYTVAAVRKPRAAAIASAAAFAAVSVHVFVPADGNPGLDGLVPAMAWVVVPLAIGVTVRASRDAATRAREDQARRIVDDERLRIAQEVHDVVGHGLAAITMQAEIALHLLPRRPEQAETALAAISRTSRDALDELRVTLAVVRRGDDRAPAPGLAGLPALRDRLADAGLPVALTVEGDPAGLPAAIDLAGYRVVQESLTNVLRHAGTATASVLVECTPDAVRVEVCDTGRGAPVVAGGSGIAGMRERVTALGGTLEAGPRPGAGFRVYAVLPLPAGGAS